MAESALTPIEIGLTAAIVAVEADEPFILVTGESGSGEKIPGLPFGPFDPIAHRTLDIGLRGWVKAQTALTVGYVEQLYTFGDRGRHARPDDAEPHMVSVGYLALTRVPKNAARCSAPARASSRVSVLSVGGLARRPARDPRRGDASSARTMGAHHGA